MEHDRNNGCAWNNTSKIERSLRENCNLNKDCRRPENYHHLLGEDSPKSSKVVKSLVRSIQQEQNFHCLRGYVLGW